MIFEIPTLGRYNIYVKGDGINIKGSLAGMTTFTVDIPDDADVDAYLEPLDESGQGCGQKVVLKTRSRNGNWQRGGARNGTEVRARNSRNVASADQRQVSATVEGSDAEVSGVGRSEPEHESGLGGELLSDDE